MWRSGFLAIAFLLATVEGAAAIEEPSFRTVHKYSDFEIRDYPTYLVAETRVDASFEDAANRGFRRLFRYIAGDNTARRKIAMTAPVIQSGQKIDMTAPVIQSGVAGSYVVRFVMPKMWTSETIPEPTDNTVAIRLIPAAKVAVVRYSGTWSAKNYDDNLARLRNAMARENLIAAGDPVWARYDPPFTPWFLRRNEILIPLAMAK